VLVTMQLISSRWHCHVGFAKCGGNMHFAAGNGPHVAAQHARAFPAVGDVCSCTQQVHTYLLLLRQL
jgi:hypothetical protein